MPDLDPVALAAYGLPGLFILAFLAGTVLPFPSEALMIALLVGGTPPVLTFVIALAGNLLGAATLYWVGRRLIMGNRGRFEQWLARITRVDPARLERLMEGLRRWGPAALLLSWLPFVGDLLVLAAGAVGVQVAPFLVFAGIGKAVRFAVVAFATLAAAGSL